MQWQFREAIEQAQWDKLPLKMAAIAMAMHPNAPSLFAVSWDCPVGLEMVHALVDFVAGEGCDLVHSCVQSAVSVFLMVIFAKSVQLTWW